MAQIVFYPREVRIRGGILNSHTHPRDRAKEGDGRADAFVPYYSEVYDDVIAIGNTKVPLTTPEIAMTQKGRWQGLSPKTKIHVAGIMTESTKPEDVIAGYDLPHGQEAWIAMKMFLRAVSNSGGADVDDVRKVIPCIKAMATTRWKHKKKPMVLKIHCERKFTPVGRRIAMMDREARAIERDVEYILREVPEAVIEICHVSDGDTIEAIRYYQSRGYRVHGEIGEHYTDYTLDDLFEDGSGGTAFNSHVLNWPIFKTNKDRRIIHDAMLSGEPWFHFGNDEACHDHDTTKESDVKVNCHGLTVGGQTKVPREVISFLIEKFVEAGRLDQLDDFVCHNARRLYDLQRDEELETRFVYRPHLVQDQIVKRIGDKTICCQVTMAGQARMYLPEGV